MSAVASLLEALGPEVVRVAPVDERYHRDWSVAPAGRPAAVVLPRSTEEVSRALSICNGFGQAVVPQGGRTGLAGAATPRDGDVVLSLERLAGIEALDELAGTMTVRAGTILQHAQEAAAEVGWELAYDLGARGSCQIGGNLATNAGGNRVIRYGMAREQVLGLEVVLADGTVLTALTPMQKNNTGYDLKGLFCGSEGTLGVITRAVLRLHPAPRSRTLALCSFASFGEAAGFLRHARSRSSQVSAFEVMWPFFYDHVTAALGVAPPLPPGAGMYALVELSGDDPAGDEDRCTDLLAEALGGGLLVDATVARSAADAAALWRIREGEPIDRLPDVANFDVSLAVGEIGRCGDDCEAAIRGRWPEAVVFAYGHIGDGNLHLSVSLGPGTAHLHHALDEVVYSVVREMGGSISAEHGIGTLKREFLGWSRSPAELAVMAALKQALDPRGILNPGKVL